MLVAFGVFAAIAAAGSAAVHTSSTAAPRAVFRLPGGDRLDHAILTRDDQPILEGIDPAALAANRMTATLSGVLHVWEGRDVRQLMALVPPRGVDPDAYTPGPRFGVLRLYSDAGIARTVDLHHTPVPAAYQRDPDTPPDTIIGLVRDPGDGPERVLFDPEAFDEIARAWPVYQDGFADAPPTGVRTLESDLSPSPYRFTPHFAVARLDHDQRGRRLRGVEPLTRTLEGHAFSVRYPPNYDPRTPAGVLVWVSPGETMGFPASMTPAADELGLVMVAMRDAGNTVPTLDRFQLIMDALHNARIHAHIDPNRVYVTGMSGGGRMSSMCWGVLPDVFTGAIPIVGMNTQHAVPAPGGKRWAGQFAEPNGTMLARLRTHRIAAITGTEDFNDLETRRRTEALTTRGFESKVFSVEGMGHELPPAETFAEALRWIDEPRSAEVALQSQAANEAYNAWRLSRDDDTEPLTPEDIAALLDVCRLGPWSPAAWKAAERLGLTVEAVNPGTP